jgi:hypothetical protein
MGVIFAFGGGVGPQTSIWVQILWPKKYSSFGSSLQQLLKSKIVLCYETRSVINGTKTLVLFDNFTFFQKGGSHSRVQTIRTL